MYVSMYVYYLGVYGLHMFMYVWALCMYDMLNVYVMYVLYCCAYVMYVMYLPRYLFVYVCYVCLYVANDCCEFMYVVGVCYECIIFVRVSM